jgi:hypothetical protein
LLMLRVTVLPIKAELCGVFMLAVVVDVRQV